MHSQHNRAEGDADRFVVQDERGEHAEGEQSPADLQEAEVAEEAFDSEATGGAQSIAAALEAQGRAGANWFYWIAGLSVVNSAILLLGADIHFVVGLGITQFVDVIAAALAQQAPENATLFRVISIGLNAIVVAVVLLLGWLSNRRFTSIFLLGMTLYLLDGLLFVLFGDWMSVAFHVFALYCMSKGWSAFRQLNSLIREPAPAAA
ncbi:MAG: hypothetical protein ACT4QC_08260 [Planctomycetaceae bacterium]